MQQQRDRFRLTIKDNGCGGDAPPGSGIRGMMERVEGLGGRVLRDGTDGTAVTITLPLKSARDLPLARELSIEARGQGGLP